MTATWEWQEGTIRDRPARRVVVRCAHGSSAIFVLPGSDLAGNLAVLDVLRVRHARTHACRCADATATRV